MYNIVKARLVRCTGYAVVGKHWVVAWIVFLVSQIFSELICGCSASIFPAGITQVKYAEGEIDLTAGLLASRVTRAACQAELSCWSSQSLPASDHGKLIPSTVAY